MEGDDVVVRVLGTAQDGGVPQLGCSCVRCERGRREEGEVGRRRTASLGVEGWVVDAGWDIREQLGSCVPVGVLLTHAHVGHYIGLLHLGKEAAATPSTSLYLSPSFAAFLSSNQPFASLLEDHHIRLFPTLPSDPPIPLSSRVSATPVSVPHRSEHSDTYGWILNGPNHRLLYIPDCDHFNWDIDSLLHQVSFALLDGTFFDSSELPGRDLSKIPHPFIVDSMVRLAPFANKIWFTHFNHSNRVLDPGYQLPNGFHLAQEGMVFSL